MKINTDSCLEVLQVIGLIIGAILFCLFIVWLYNDAPCGLFMAKNLPYRCLVELTK